MKNKIRMYFKVFLSFSLSILIVFLVQASDETNHNTSICEYTNNLFFKKKKFVKPKRKIQFDKEFEQRKIEYIENIKQKFNNLYITGKSKCIQKSEEIENLNFQIESNSEIDFIIYSDKYRYDYEGKGFSVIIELKSDSPIKIYGGDDLEETENSEEEEDKISLDQPYNVTNRQKLEFGKKDIKKLIDSEKIKTYIENILEDVNSTTNKNPNFIKNTKIFLLNEIEKLYIPKEEIQLKFMSSGYNFIFLKNDSKDTYGLKISSDSYDILVKDIMTYGEIFEIFKGINIHEPLEAEENTKSANLEKKTDLDYQKLQKIVKNNIVYYRILPFEVSLANLTINNLRNNLEYYSIETKNIIRNFILNTNINEKTYSRSSFIIDFLYYTNGIIFPSILIDVITGFPITDRPCYSIKKERYINYRTYLNLKDKDEYLVDQNDPVIVRFHEKRKRLYEIELLEFLFKVYGENLNLLDLLKYCDFDKYFNNIAIKELIS